MAGGIVKLELSIYKDEEPGCLEKTFLRIDEELYEKGKAKELDFLIVLERAIMELTRTQKLSELYQHDWETAHENVTKLEARRNEWQSKASEAYDRYLGQLNRETQASIRDKKKKPKEAGK